VDCAKRDSEACQRTVAERPSSGIPADSGPVDLRGIEEQQVLIHGRVDQLLRGGRQGDVIGWGRADVFLEGRVRSGSNEGVLPGSSDRRGVDQR
jgi:hypothetical protein